MRYFKFNDILISNTGDYILNGTTNLETGSSTKRKIKYIDSDGVSYRDITYNERPFEISGWIMAENEFEMVERKRKLISSCSLKNSVELEYFNRQDRYKAECYFDKLPTFGTRVGWNLPFKLYLSIPEFYWLSFFIKKIDLFYYEDTVTNEFSLPCIFTKRVDTPSTVYNSGDCETDCIFEIINEGTSSEQTIITNEENQKSIIINHTLKENETLTIDTKKNTVTSSIEGDITPKISLDTEFFKIQRGKNTISCSSAGNFIRVLFYERFLGV